MYFKQPGAASAAVRAMQNKVIDGVPLSLALLVPNVTLAATHDLGRN